MMMMMMIEKMVVGQFSEKIKDKRLPAVMAIQRRKLEYSGSWYSFTDPGWMEG